MAFYFAISVFLSLQHLTITVMSAQVKHHATHVSRAFPTTRWSFIRALGDSESELRRELLGEFFLRYRSALRAHLAHQFRGLTNEDYDDLIQSFIVDRIICSQLLQEAAEPRGKFRNYLKTCLNNFAVDWYRLASNRHARECGTLELHHHPATAKATHTECFEVLWAKQIIHDTVSRMRADLEQRGRSQVWIVFEQRLLNPALHGIEPIEIETLSEQLATSTQRVYNLLVTARRNFRKRLREVVSEYTSDDTDIDEEIEDLMHYLHGDA